MNHPIPKKLIEQIYQDHGRDTRLWPQELQDLFNPSIEPKQINPPNSLSIKTRKNTNYEYKWIEDKMGANPNHDRVESLRAVGWEFATTEDVVMANEFTVKNRRGGKEDGFSNEIRNGDLRMMKIPMILWRAKRKAENVAAYQMAYPQILGGATGRPMTSEEFSQQPGSQVPTELLTGQELADTDRRFRPENTSEMRKPKQQEG